MEPTENYITGFNHGYVLAKYEPDLSETLDTGVQGATDYAEGLKHGREELLKEQLHELRASQERDDRERE